MTRVGIAAIVKNEARYLLEWIAFHRVVGIHKLFIADNGGDDDTSELLERLDRAGYIVRFDFVGRSAVQCMAYNDIVPRMREFVDLAAIVDADEFIRPLGSRRVDTVFANLFADPSVSGLAMNWALYGSSRRIRSGFGLVTKRFSMRAEQEFEINRHVKVVVRIDRFLGCDNPHFAKVSEGRYVATNGEDVQWHPVHGAGVSTQCHWQGVRVDHFVVKSLKEFKKVKQPRGRVSLPKDHPLFFRNDSFFTEHDRNDVYDPMPSWLLWTTRAEIMRMRWRLFGRAPLIGN